MKEVIFLPIPLSQECACILHKRFVNTHDFNKGVRIHVIYKSREESSELPEHSFLLSEIFTFDTFALDGVDHLSVLWFQTFQSNELAQVMDWSQYFMRYLLFVDLRLMNHAVTSLSTQEFNQSITVHGRYRLAKC